MGLFGSKSKNFSKIQNHDQEEETEPLHHGETIEMSEPGQASSSSPHYSQHDESPIYRKIGKWLKKVGLLLLIWSLILIFNTNRVLLRIWKSITQRHQCLKSRTN
ncbi:unnamed protein product [Mucor hiemalis]